ncbi:MAG: DNA-directed RNA polymerase subunit A' [Nanoarchaeota archaeon]
MMMEHIHKKVSSIVFGLVSPETIEKSAVAKIVTPELYDKEGYPVDGGLMDIRLGVIDPGLHCKTCGGRLKECIGHFGYIELARPVVHILFGTKIFEILKATCRSCSRILLTSEEISKEREILARYRKIKQPALWRKRAKLIVNKAKTIKKCPHCNEKQHAVKIEKPTTFVENDKKVNPAQVKARLEKIPDKDMEILGIDAAYARPEWMILKVLMIPPVTMRPSITLETGERSEDDLTHKLGDIVRINQRLFENINAGAPEIIVEDLWDLLQYHVTTYFDNTVIQVPPARHRSGQVLKTLTERIKSKEGRFRHNLAGKRVNFAARTVISPDPKIKFNEVGIPKSVAMELTIPERVTTWNKEWLLKLIRQGQKNYPGANYVIFPDGKKKKITDETQESILADLKEGFIVERHVMDYDVSIFNRQPSLHRMSIMCHRVRVLPGKSFRLNPSVCNPYNADFDGDEMNLHIPQTEEARAEAEILMQVETQIMTPKSGYNVIGCVEDPITGNYLLTKDKTLTREEAGELLTSIGLDRIKYKGEKVSGKELISSLFPEDFSFFGSTKKIGKDGKAEQLIIKNGKIISGFIDSNSIGENNGELVREFYRKYDKERTLELLGNLFLIGIKVLLKYGFTTGIADTDIPKEIIAKIYATIEITYKEVDDLIKEYEAGKLEELPGKTLKETLETRVLELLNKVRNKVGTIVAEYPPETNSTIIMARAGAKGNILNFTQMSGCVGQQALGGKRIERGYMGRTLSLFKEKDLGPLAHGFIKSSFKRGLNPVEFFFHAMTGRDALMDTALRTPKSGYLYRRLANALQDLKVEYDHTVRNAHNHIVQFKYGEDGIDVSKSEGGKINVIKAISDITGK